MLGAAELMVRDFVLITIGLLALFVGGNALVHGAARLATALRVSSILIGLTIVAFGTSVPELLVGIDSAFKGVSDIALGNVVGSNIANIGLLLGITAVIHPITIEWSLLKREIPILIGISIVVILMALDGSIGQIDGWSLLIGFALFNLFSYQMVLRDRRRIAAEVAVFSHEEGLDVGEHFHPLVESGRLLIGIALLIVGAQFTVDGGVNIAQALGVSDFLIGITLVAFGTSLPELTTSIVGAMRRQNDIVMANAIGSNVANLLVILGVTAVLMPIPVQPQIVQFDMLVMLGFALLLLLFLRRNVIGRWQGVAFLLLYLGFIVMTIQR